MKKNIIFVFMIVLVLAGLGYAMYSKYSKGTFFADFGDAPDGGATGYSNPGAAIGSFPSKLASNGARAVDINQLWLGQAVDKDTDSKQVNHDLGDDGVRVNFNSCAASSASFYVAEKTPGKLTGKAYLNLYVDWNKDGKWSGSDACADEWAVKNYPVDLANINQSFNAISTEFPGGKEIKDLWYRATISYDQQLASDARGEIKIGEVEDYGPGIPENDSFYDAFCNPDPLKINHGGQGAMTVVNSFWSTATITGIDLPNGFTAVNGNRNVSIKGGQVIYQSKKVDPPKRVVADPVSIRVDYGKEASIVIICWVEVKHDEPTPTPTITSSAPPVTSPKPTVTTTQDGQTTLESTPSSPTPTTTQSDHPGGLPAGY